MKKIKLCPIIWIIGILFIFIRCSKDLGNYNYQEINEVKIDNWKSSYALLTDFDTLRATADFTSTQNIKDPSQYEFRWVLKKGSDKVDTIGTSQHLEYPIVLPLGKYILQLRIRDKNTNVVFFKSSELFISTPYTRGILLIGEDANEKTEADMISMITDTILIKDIIKNSGIDGKVDGPLQFMYAGGYAAIHKLAWILTKSGSYYLDPKTMKYEPKSMLSNFLLPTDPINVANEFAVDIAPQMINIDGSLSDEIYKVLVTTTGNIYTTHTFFGAGYFLNPINKTERSGQELLPAAAYLMYEIGGLNSIMWYDTKNDQFMKCGQLLGGQYSQYPEDKQDDPFSWNLKPQNKKLIYAENTFNQDAGFRNGNTFAVVKSNSNFNIYKFNANGNKPVKLANYPIKPIALNFDKAESYAFSSKRSIVFYVYNETLFAYNYNPGNEKFYEIQEFKGKKVSMIKFDTQQEPSINSLYVATYDSQRGGTLQRLNLDNNPNSVKLIPVDHAKWEGLIKIKNMNWKNEKY